MFAKYLTYIFMSLLLASCGGGDGGSSPSSSGPSPSQQNGRPALMSWSGSASGPWIYVSNGGIVAFTQNQGYLYDYHTQSINQSVVANGFSVSVNGVVVGSVMLTKNASNESVATIRCTNGTYAAKVTSGGATSLTCNGNSGGSGNPSGGSSGGTPSGGSSGGAKKVWFPEASRMQCVKVISTNTGGSRWQNSCSERVEVEECFTGSSGQRECVNSSEIYGQMVFTGGGSFQIPAGSTYPVVCPYSKCTTIQYMVCKLGYTPHLMANGGANCLNYLTGDSPMTASVQNDAIVSPTEMFDGIVELEP